MSLNERDYNHERNSKQKIKIKKRYQNIKFKLVNTLEKEISAIRISSDQLTGVRVDLINKIGDTVCTSIDEVECFYNRESKKKKILYSYPVREEMQETDVNKDITSYDLIIVVDTSYELINDIKVAFTSIVICTKVDESLHYRQISQVIEWDATSIEKPENFMYIQVIEKIRLHNIKNNQNPNIAVIVDSDLENISLFNKKSLPIYENYYLPDKFFLFYASSDSGNEFLPNKLMKYCDSEAKKALDEYRKR